MTNLILTGRREPGAGRPAHAQLLGDGLVHLDYGDADSVFLVRVTRVSRERHSLTPPTRLGLVDGRQVALLEVTLANHVTVRLEAEPPDGPDNWSAERLMSVEINVSDDIGTRYRFFSGQAGGDGFERTALLSFRPASPMDATQLLLRLHHVGQDLTEVTIDLDRPSDGSATAALH